MSDTTNTSLVSYTDKGDMSVNCRELHKSLCVESNYTTWFKRMCEIGMFEENKDFFPILEESTGGRPSTNHSLTINMAKELCMLQRNDKGKQFRKYFIQVEENWNKPELVIARALQYTNSMLESERKYSAQLEHKIEEDAPKVLFADAVTTSDTVINVRDLAKIINQNGYPMGEKRLYKWMRENAYILQGSTSPTQKAMNMGLFAIQENIINVAGKKPLVTQTTKVTMKGQQYFINKLISKE